MSETTNEEDKKEYSQYFYAICESNGKERQYIIPVFSKTFENDVTNVLLNRCLGNEEERILRSFRAQAAGRLSDSSRVQHITRIEIPVKNWPKRLAEAGMNRLERTLPNTIKADLLDTYMFYKTNQTASEA